MQGYVARLEVVLSVVLAGGVDQGRAIFEGRALDANEAIERLLARLTEPEDDTSRVSAGARLRRFPQLRDAVSRGGSASLRRERRECHNRACDAKNSRRFRTRSRSRPCDCLRIEK